MLNLAGNEIVHTAGLAGMTSLAELNLRRNRIMHTVSPLHGTHKNVPRIFSMKWTHYHNYKDFTSAITQLKSNNSVTMHDFIVRCLIDFLTLPA